MVGLENYIDQIKEKASKHLYKEYQINNFSPNNFELINFYLIDKAISQERNLFIKTLTKKQNQEIYLPSVISVIISLFFKNFCDDSTTYEVGKIVQKEKMKYRIQNKTEEGFVLISTDKHKTQRQPSFKQIKTYSIVNTEISHRRAKVGLNDYKKFFNTIFPSVKKDFPSEFKYKSVIVLDKKHFLNELKEQTFTEINLLKAIPFQWVNKNGKFETSQIPIDPMIYLVPDYETFQEYILDANIDVETVIFIGKNKYTEDSLKQLKKDLRNEEVPFSIIIGSENVKDEFDLFSKWNWTIPEVAIIKDYEPAEISLSKIPNDEYQNQINHLANHIEKLNNEFDIELPSFNGFKKLLYSLVIPKDKSRLENQIEFLIYLITKTYCEAIDECLLNQNINPKEQSQLIKIFVKNIFIPFSNNKLEYIKNHDFDFLIVPNRFAEIWKEESELNVLGYNEFIEKQDSFKSYKKFLLISPFCYSPVTYELIYQLRTTKHDYTFLVYEEEETIISSLNNRYENNLAKELNSNDRVQLSEVIFPYEEKSESVSELIDRIDDKTSIYNSEGNEYESVNYRLDFQNGESLILDGRKSVLIEKGTEKRKINVCNIINSDKVRIYANLSKDLLFETATKQDTNSRFSEIENHSLLWKQCLIDFYNSKNYSVDNLLNDLKKEGISIKNTFTLKNWLNLNSSIKFPQKKSDLLVVSRTINNTVLTSQLGEITKSRNTYKGIMIALGRDLSDEIMDYIIHRRKGAILDSFTDLEVNALADKSAPLRIVKQILITEENESEQY
jgi:hypothetical protein